MKILFDMLHPAHVLKFKEVIKKLKEDGHKVIVTSRDKDVTCHLLNAFMIPHTTISKMGKGKLSLLKELISRNLKLLKICLKEKPDVLVGFNGISIAQVGWLLRIPSVYVTDDEDAKLLTTLGIPFATKVLTEESFELSYKPKHYFIDGFFEQTYITGFIPNPSVLEDNNLKEDEPFSVVRFVAWKAIHDVGEKGLSQEYKLKLIKKLEEKGKVLVSTEETLPIEFKRYKIKSNPEKIHSLLFYASMYVGDSQAMANEAGMLGTPSIRCNTLVETIHSSGKFAAMQKLGRVYSTSNPVNAIEFALKNYGKRKPVLVNKNTISSIINIITSI